MSSLELPHYNTVLKKILVDEANAIYQPCALERPYSKQYGWPIRFPELSDTIIVPEIVIHLQDSLTFDGTVCLELQKIESHYEELANKVIVIVEDIGLCNTYKGPLQVIWFPTFCYELMAQMRHCKSHWDHYINYENKITWQCLNGIPRHQRVKVANYLSENHANGILSLANDIPLQSHSYDDVYHGAGNDNPDNFLMLDWVYKDCAINIVTETVYDFRPGIITEKTLFAFLAGQVPLVIGHAGIVQELREMGFDMFEDIVDTSYDWLDNDHRWKAAIDLNENLLRSTVKKQDFYERLSYNKNYALNTWPQRCIDWYKQQILALDIQLSTDPESFPNRDTFWPA